MCIPYFGGKARMASWINKYIPKTIDTYVEPFSGAFWTYINGEVYCDTVVYNDFNRYMVNLYACLKDHKAFVKKLESVKARDEDLFYKFQKECLQEGKIDSIQIPDFEYGLKYAYVLTQVFSGTNPEKGSFIEMPEDYTSKYNSLIRKLHDRKYKKKLSKITNFENLDFEKVIKKYDGEKSFFYTDPPYYGFEKDGKQAYAFNDFARKDHERLTNVLHNIKGRFALSYYDFDGIEDFYDPKKFRYIRKKFKKSAGGKKGKKQSTSTEVLILNY